MIEVLQNVRYLVSQFYKYSRVKSEESFAPCTKTVDSEANIQVVSIRNETKRRSCSGHILLADNATIRYE